MWKKDRFEGASVIHNVIEYPEYEQLYNYAMIHPEQFDPNEVEQLKILSFEQKEALQGSINNKVELD